MTGLGAGGRRVPAMRPPAFCPVHEITRDPIRLATPARTGTRSMQIYVARLNIEHFRKLIAAEFDPKKLDLLRRLLAEEEAKLVRLLAPGATPS